MCYVTTAIYLPATNMSIKWHIKPYVQIIQCTSMGESMQIYIPNIKFLSSLLWPEMELLYTDVERCSATMMMPQPEYIGWVGHLVKAAKMSEFKYNQEQTYQTTQ